MTLSSVETFEKCLKRFVVMYISSIYVIEVFVNLSCLANLWKVILFFIVVQINWKFLFIKRVFKIVYYWLFVMKEN